MAKRLLKTLLLPILALATALAFIACDGETTTTDVKFTVTYSIGADATGTAPTETDKASGEKFTLKTDEGIVPPAGKKFGGWNDGSSTYQAGDTYTMPGKNVTFTAKWDDDTPASKYTVTYKHGAALDDNGDAVADIAAENQPAGNYTVGNPSLYHYVEEEEASYLFSGWVNEKNKNDEKPTVYLPGQSFTLAENTTLEAVWVKGDNIVFAAADTSSTITLYAYSNGIGAYWYVDTQEKEVWTFFTYTQSEGTITATPVGGTAVTGTFNENGALSMEINGHTYTFAPDQEPPEGVPTFTFQLNGGTGSVPTLTVTQDMYSEASGKYMVPMPANTINPPAGKDFKRWLIDDGTGAWWPKNAGLKFPADEGVAYTVKPEWKDATVTPVVPTGTKYTGNWNTPAGQGGLSAVPSVNITEVWLNKQTNKLYYVVGGTTKEATVATNSDELTVAMKTAYGDGAALYSVTIETLAYNLVVKADNSKLAFAGTNAEMTLYTDGEFTVAAPAVTYTVTYNKPEDATGTMEDVTADAGAYTLVACDYEKAGWDFLGWKDESLTSRDKPVLVATGATVTLSKNMSYVAVFAKTYTNSDNDTVTIDLRDDEYVLWDFGDGDPEYLTWEQDENHVYVYWGWDLMAYLEISGNTYTALDAMAMPLYTFTTKDDTTTLTFDGKGHATLGSHQGTYTILYNDDGYIEGVKVTFDSVDYECYFEYDGDYKPHIYKTITAGGTAYEFDPFTAWYTITFEVDNDVTGAPASPVRIHNSIGGDNQATVEFPDTYDMKKTGYIFIGWGVKGSDGTVGNAVNTYKYKVTADTAFAAIWHVEAFNVTYSAGDVGEDAVTGFDSIGTISTSARVNPNSLEGNISKLPTKNQVTRTGYTLQHWIIQGDDSGDTYLPGASNVKVTADTTFVAVWEAETPNPGGDTLTLASLTGSNWTGGPITIGSYDYDKASFNGNVLSLQEAAYAPDAFNLTESFEDGKLVAVCQKSSSETITLTFTDANHFTITYVKTGMFGTTESGNFTRDGGTAPEGSDKIAYYIGESSTNAAEYGYSSAANAGSNVITLGGNECYGVKIYFSSSKAYAKLLGGATCYIRKLNTTTTITPDDDLEVQDASFSLSATSISNVTISFKVEDGKRKVTVSDGTNSVTWTEITPAA